MAMSNAERKHQQEMKRLAKKTDEALARVFRRAVRQPTRPSRPKPMDEEAFED
jgi:hypothetical protein